MQYQWRGPHDDCYKWCPPGISWQINLLRKQTKGLHACCKQIPHIVFLTTYSGAASCQWVECCLWEQHYLQEAACSGYWLWQLVQILSVSMGPVPRGYAQAQHCNAAWAASKLRTGSCRLRL